MGHCKGCSCRTVLSTLQRMTSVAHSIEVRRKFKKVGEKTVRWWFFIRGEEPILQSLESEWTNIESSTSWKLKLCYQPATPSPESNVPREPTLSPDQPTCSLTNAGEVPEPKDPPTGVTNTLSDNGISPGLGHGGENTN